MWRIGQAGGVRNFSREYFAVDDGETALPACSFFERLALALRDEARAFRSSRYAQSCFDQIRIVGGRRNRWNDHERFRGR